jgi:D-glycero-D-manno-heptose 1,7-bisphosphate phosphatase
MYDAALRSRSPLAFHCKAFLWPDPIGSDTNQMKRAVFFDRDGTLILDRGYMSHPSQVELMHASELLKSLHANRFQIVITSNQSGVGRGLMTASEAEAVTAELLRQLALQGASVDAVYYCPHAPEDGCECRKPKPGMLLRAARDVGIELKESFLVGDKPSDCEAGQSVGCQPIYLTKGHTNEGIPGSWMLASNLQEVLEAILEALGPSKEAQES